MTEGAIRIGHLYPRDMNLYGDRGNVLALCQRLAWRGIQAEVVPIEVGSAVDWDDLALLFMGGGEDAHQVHIAEDFLQRGEAILPRLERGLPMLAICGAYQLLGREYVTTDNRHVPGLGFLDVHTEAGSSRMIGNVASTVTAPALGMQTLVGFENHAGKTYLGPSAVALAEVQTGSGNNGSDRTEGVVRGHVVGSYLHGSLLPKNPNLADCLLTWALEYIRHGEGSELSLLDDDWEDMAHAAALQRISMGRSAKHRSRK